MNQKLMRAMLYLMLLAWLPLTASAADPVQQLQFGKQTITVPSNEEITFYDWKGTDKINSSSSNNAHSLTVFQPAEAGMSIQITFETCDVTNDGTSWPGQVHIYSGDPDADNTFAWATTTSGVTASTTMPAGDKLDVLDGTYSNLTYLSASADGSLSVGVLWRYAKGGNGWVAKVKCVKLENQEVTGAGSSYENVAASPTTKVNVPLAAAFVTAVGVMNPDNVTGITFRMTKNDAAIDPLAMKLFAGNSASLKDATQIEATVAAEGDHYLMTLNAAPSEGTTYFTLAADLLGTAAVGAQVQVDILGVTTAAFTEGVTPFTAAESVIVSNPALVLMNSETAQVVTVGETALKFYDEGGADGTIKGTASGQVTFLSGVDGKKVSIDFSSITLNNGSMYYQALKVYNGQSTAAADLLKELRNGDVSIVNSTAADGALTVVLEAASQTYDYDGWDATVSLFTPQPMEVDEFVVSKFTEGTVAAGDVNQQILNFNLKTKYTEPALTASAFSFTTNDTYARVSRATLYYTGSSNSFSAQESNKVGTVEVTDNAFVITATESLTLVEGDNYFWLSYDISDEALNGETVDAALTAATLNGSAVDVANGNPEGSRTVENIVYCYANMGSETRTVNGSLSFMTKKASSYSSYCEAGTDDRIVTFVPKHAGMVVQIDFSEFEVQYASSSYGTKSKFIIYSGKDTNGDILWQLNSNDQQSTGPGSIIRSTAEDGAITIVFNPNSSYSYYYKGFNATVSEYLSQNMQVSSVEVTQTTTDVVSIGGKNQALLTVKVTTEGNLEPLILNALTLDLKGTQQNMDAVHLYSVGNQDVAPTGDAVATAATTEEQTLTLTLAEPVVLKEGDNYLRINVDVAADAEAESTIDAAVTAVKVGDTDVQDITGDPEGSRTLKLMYLLQSGDNGELTLTEGRPIMFYDDGGPEGNASANFTGSITFVPQSPADAIQLDFQSWDVYYTSKFNIYQGGAVTDTYDAQYSMYDHPSVVRSQSEDGKLTVQFTTGSSGPAGFAIQVSAYKKAPVSIASVTTETLAPSEVLKGETDVQMLKIAVEAEGELGSVDLKSVNFTATDASAIVATKVYATGTTDAFSANTLYGTAEENAQSVNGTYTISAPGTYYFWLTYDVASDAEVGSTVDATVTSLLVNEQSIDVTEAATASFTVATGKSGEFTVGLSGDVNYNSIQAAIDDIAHLGIDGPVVLNIKAGEYNEKVSVPLIKGMSAVNTLTIQSESGNYGDVRIFHNSYTTAGYSDDQMAKEYGVFTFNGACYTTLKGVEITTTDLTYPSVVHVKNQSRHCTIDACYIHTETSTSYSNSIKLIGHYAENVENRNNDYLTVSNNLLEGGYIGVSMGGTGYVALPKEVGGVIIGNTLKNQGSKALYVMDELGAKVQNNIIINNVETNTNFQGIDTQLRDEYTESMEITGNIFNIASTKYGGGIFLRQMTASAEAPTIVANNVINVTSLNASYYGLKVDNKTFSNLNIANNTIRMTGENGGAALWFSTNMTDATGIVVVNNIVQNETNGYAINFYTDNNITVPTFQNNTFYTAGETFFRGSTSVTGDFADFVERTGATGCINAQVNFLSESILEPADNLEGQLLTALPLAYVTTDVAGVQRSETPTIGAYEYSDENEDPVIAEGYPLLASTSVDAALIAVKADANGTAYALLRMPDQEAPTLDDVLLSETKTTITRDTEATIKFEQLESATDYIAYLVVENTRGKHTEVIAVPFTTATVIPDVAIEAEGETVNEGESATLLVSVTSGTAPFNIEWRNGLHEVIGSTTLETMDEVSSFQYAPTYCDDYYVTVTDANMRTATDTARIVVRTAEPIVADFENLFLEENAFWKGPDTKGTIHAGSWGGKELHGSFVSGSYQFDNSYNTTYDSWAGFAYSNRTATTFRSYTTDDCNSIVGHGVDDSSNFAVSFDNSTVEVLSSTEGTVIPGFYLTNAAVTVNAILNGDGMTTGAFTTGDFVLLTITGHHPDATTEDLQVYLADYTSENEEEHSYLNDWQYVDLSTLGTVTKVTFSMSSSRNNSYGMTTPAYFCIDNFGAAPVIPEIAIVAEGDEINAGEEATLTLYPADGVAPFQYQWLNGKHEVIGEGIIESLDEVMATITYVPAECDDYYVFVTDAAGQTACDTARVVVRTAEPVVATFENLYLEEESFWKGPDTKGEEVMGAWGDTQLAGSFVSGSYQFDNNYSLDWGSWSGFAYSNRTATTFQSYATDDCNSIVGHGADDSENFAVIYDNATVEVLASTEGAVIPGFYLTNSANNVKCYLNGDGYTDAFTTGDSFTLTVTGYNGTEVTGTVEVLLADYTSDNEEKHTYIADWQYVDISTLGTVTAVTFSFSGGHSNTWGMTTPAYACIDNFGAEKPIDVAIVTAKTSFDTADVEAIYTTDGRRISRLQKGINIVRMSDGTTRRVLLK